MLTACFSIVGLYHLNQYIPRSPSGSCPSFPEQDMKTVQSFTILLCHLLISQPQLPSAASVDMPLDALQFAKVVNRKTLSLMPTSSLPPILWSTILKSLIGKCRRCEATGCSKTKKHTSGRAWVLEPDTTSWNLKTQTEGEERSRDCDVLLTTLPSNSPVPLHIQCVFSSRPSCNLSSFHLFPSS